MEFLGSKWRGQHYPEFEDVCSGEGLLRCYEWAVKRRKGVPVVGADAEFVAQEVSFLCCTDTPVAACCIPPPPPPRSSLRVDSCPRFWP